MAAAFQLDPDSVIMTSAKQRIGIEELMQAIIDRLPPPSAPSANQSNSSLSPSSSSPPSPLAGTQFRGRIVDSWFDEHRGVVCLVQVVSGKITEGQVKHLKLFRYI